MAALSRTLSMMPLSPIGVRSDDGRMRSIDVTRYPDQSRPDRRCARSATLVVRQSHGSGPLAARRRRFTDRVAVAEVLLTDAAGPLYNRHNQAALPALLRSAIAQLDPAASLAEPAVA